MQEESQETLQTRKVISVQFSYSPMITSHYIIGLFQCFIYHCIPFWNSLLLTISALGDFSSLTVESSLTSTFALQSHLTVSATSLRLASSLVMEDNMKASLLAST